MSEVTIDRVLLAVDTEGREWVPADEYRREEQRWEALRSMVVNPLRYTRRARAALDRGDLDRVRELLALADAELARAHGTAFPPKTS